jgi:hypothetical protein
MDAQFGLIPKKRTSTGLGVHVDNPHLAWEMGTGLGGFSWGRFYFYIVLRNGRELNYCLAAIRNALE